MIINKIIYAARISIFLAYISTLILILYIYFYTNINNSVYISSAVANEYDIVDRLVKDKNCCNNFFREKSYIFGKDILSKSGVLDYKVEKLIGQGLSTSVSVLFEPKPIDGRHFAVAAQISANSPGVGDKVGVYAAAQTGVYGSDVWSLNSLVSWRPTDPDVNVQGYELDFNNMNMPLTLNPKKLKVGLNVTSGGLYNGGYALFVDATRKPANSWRQGLHISRDAVTDTGLFIAASNPALTGTIVAGQISNNNDTLLLQRASDTDPNGHILRVVNAANSKNLWSIKADTLSTSIGVSSSLAQLHVAPSTDPSITPAETYLALGLENNSSATKGKKGISLGFYGRDINSIQKIIGSLDLVSTEENWINSEIVFKARKNDSTTEKMRIRGSGHILFSGARPTITSCGLDPKIKGTDVAGSVTLTNDVKTCTLNFSTTYSSEPFCLVVSQLSVIKYNVTKSNIVVDTKGTSNFRYICVEAENIN